MTIEIQVWEGNGIEPPRHRLERLLREREERDRKREREQNMEVRRIRGLDRRNGYERGY